MQDAATDSTRLTSTGAAESVGLRDSCNREMAERQTILEPKWLRCVSEKRFFKSNPNLDCRVDGLTSVEIYVLEVKIEVLEIYTYMYMYIYICIYIHVYIYISRDISAYSKAFGAPADRPALCSFTP